VSLLSRPIGFQRCYFSDELLPHHGNNLSSKVRLATSANIAGLTGMLIRDLAASFDRPGDDVFRVMYFDFCTCLSFCRDGEKNAAERRDIVGVDT
jgi:hypothetical protein